MIQEHFELGPIHPWLPGPLKIRLGLSGDQIIESQVGFGYSARNIEKRMVGKPHFAAQALFSHLEPESALILDRMFSEAVESILNLSASERAIWIREICGDLGEINFLLKYLARMALRLDLKVLFHCILKHREALLDLLELLSGSRFGYFFLVPGGSRHDLTEGFQERLEAWTKAFLQDYGRIEALFCVSHGFQNRLRTLGLVMDESEFGFVSSAAVESTRFGQVSHVESRILFALRSSKEIAEDIFKQLSRTPKGPHRTRTPELTSKDSVSLEMETARGPWSLDLALSAALTIEEIKVSAPSDFIRGSIGPALEDESLEDLPLILESLSLSVQEIDR